MSRAFERRLARASAEYFQENSPDAGERFVGQFYDSETIDHLVQEFQEAGETEMHSIQVAGEEVSLPVFETEDGTTVITARVRSDEPEGGLEFQEVTVGFASRLRDFTSSGAQEGSFALLLFYERNVEIDTLKSARPTPLYANDGVLPLRRIWDRVLSDDESLPAPANALLLALRAEIGEYGTMRSDIGQLRTLCALRERIEKKEYDQLPGLIPALGTYLKADEFNKEWFERGDGLDSLREVAKKHLQNNQQHAERIQDSKGVGSTPQRALDGKYEDDFITYVDQHDLSEIPHTKAEKSRISSPGPKDPDPKFTSFDMEADSWESCKLYEPVGQVEPHRGILAVTNSGQFTLTIELDREIDDPYRTQFQANGGNPHLDVEVEDATVTATASALSPSEAAFLSLSIYFNSSTLRGYPDCRFDVAVIPEWFDDARRNLNLQVDYDDAAVATSAGVAPILYVDDEDPEKIEITDEEFHLTLDRSVKLEPVYAGGDQIQCFVSDDGDPIILYLSPSKPSIPGGGGGDGDNEDNLQVYTLPLHLNAIGEPQIWSRNSDKLLVDEGLGYSPDDGEFQTSSAEGITVTPDQQQLLEIEKQIRDEGTPAPRTITRTPLHSGSVPDSATAVPDTLLEEYERLFAHLRERNRVISTDAWDDKTLDIVEDLLDTYVQELDSVNSAVYDDYRVYREIGTIQIEGIDKHWLTPYHPLMLAYGHKIATWRDSELVPQGLTDGFNEEASYEMFSPVGLFPFRYGSNTDSLLDGFTLEGHHLWCGYSGTNTTASDTPDYMDQDLAKKLYSFSQTFETLIRLHPDRPIHINLINMGDLGPVLRGLHQYYLQISKEAYSPPKILLRVISPSGQGEQLERFFNQDSESAIREDLSNQDTIDTMLRRVSYVQLDEDTDVGERDAHLTFFRRILTPDRVSRSSDEMGSSFRLGGLTPQEAVNVTSRKGETISSSGYADDSHDTQHVAEIARRVNALEPVADNEEYSPGTAFRQQIRSRGGAVELQSIWDESIWVSHVQPQVRLDFYISPRELNGDEEIEPGEESEPLMIHYSDKYDPSSAGFDVITTTNKQDLYIGTLAEALEESGALSRVSAELVLQHLVAIDGSFALKIQQAEEKTLSELIGLIGSLAISRELLKRFSPEYVWFPISLREIAQKDHAERFGRGSGFRFDVDGKASDDLCFVGLPTSPTSDLEIKLWLVEAKGGKSDANTGVEQIQGAYEEFIKKLHPSDARADTTLRHAELGQMIVNICRRLSHYGVYEDAFNLIKQHETYLINGEYEADFLRDQDGRVGDVINVDPERDKASIDHREYARILYLPSPIIELLSDESRSLEEILEFTEVSEFEFGPEGELPELSSEKAEEGDKAPPKQAERKEEEDEEAVSTDEEDGTGEPSDDTGTESDEAASDSEEPSEQDEAAESDPAPVDESVDIESLDLEYDWSSNHLQQVFKALSASPNMDVELDVKRLTAELESQFKSLGIDIHPPDPTSVTIGVQKIGVNVRPKSGQRIESILNNLDSLGVHIQAKGAISGTVNSAEGAVRLEIPHGQPKPVHLRTGLEEGFEKLDEGLTFPLGVDTRLEHHTLDLLEQRHLLVGGTTGSGKSNFLTAIVANLALTRTPELLKLSILDPKGVDFHTFADLPQVPEDGYIDDGEESVAYLLELVETEIEERREILKQSPAKSVQEHNELAEEADLEQIPYHVIVIDEFADLILALDDNRDEFIEAVQRLTQTGRAFGISMIIATQRPSANVVPGEIKANLPCRISFELPSNTDSRVILDQPGAEDLEGAGDMIVLPRTGGELQLQTYYVPAMDTMTLMKLFD